MLLLAVPNPAAAGTLQPIKSWILNYAETQCVATRDYGNPKSPTTLGISPAANGDSFQLIVGRNTHGPDVPVELHGSVDFGNGAIKAWLLHYGSKTKRGDIYQYRISAAEMAQAATAQTVTLRTSGAPDFTFALEDMQPLLAGLKQCTGDLKRYWNMDGETTGAITTPAKGDIRSIFSSDDYPSEAADRSHEGRSRFLVLIAPTGDVAGCDGLVPSGDPALDGMGCQIIRQRAKFSPARDKSGKPVRSAVTTPAISWMLER
jgi:hypothetical protein